ncbi:trna-splicing endonuclease subunit sen34 [Diplodia corticola]|uniref:tRNA-intron lyase n=1 Tax=Diplodia corticola TaxID=236234 RepID=A0A1J9RL35_9PEZI|nr:trna-splicing endonuclease subunit sen34 [Diplodia corticola]OJD40682.1 trna-splicing endonuclease subunit sen34 [Diplodia corticola]
MSGLGLDHVFPFPREDAVTVSSESPEGSEGIRTPQLVINDSKESLSERPSPEKGQPGEGSPSSLTHVFPWQRSPSPHFDEGGMETGMQVFEPFDIGDMTPTPSEWSDGQFSSAQQSPEWRRKEAVFRPDRAPTPRSVSAASASSLFRALAQPEPTSAPRSEPAIPDEELLPTPTAEEKFAPLASAADESQPAVEEDGSTEEPASPVLNVIEDLQAQNDIPVPSSSLDAVPQEPPSNAQPEPPQPQQELDTELAESSQAPPPSPVPISRIANRYMLYDTDDISYLRREHNICGVLIGTLPSHPQQNVFLGTPLELMPEEARRLVEIGAAYIVDDVERHRTGVMGLGEAERKAFLKAVEKQGLEASRANQQKADDIKKEAMKKNADKIEKARMAKQEKQQKQAQAAAQDDADGEEADSSLFASEATIRPASPVPSQAPSSTAPEDRFYITPSTSHPPLQTAPTSPPEPKELPKVPRSYPLFAYLHSRGFFMSPGLRFGCQYCIYPGDPLRFHSHYLGVGMGWDDEFDLMQLVGGGRLGTGVKKGFLVGGKETKVGQVDGEREDSAAGVRAFSIEWSGM